MPVSRYCRARLHCDRVVVVALWRLVLVHFVIAMYFGSNVCAARSVRFNGWPVVVQTWLPLVAMKRFSSVHVCGNHVCPWSAYGVDGVV